MATVPPAPESGSGDPEIAQSPGPSRVPQPPLEEPQLGGIADHVRTRFTKAASTLKSLAADAESEAAIDGPTNADTRSFGGRRLGLENAREDPERLEVERHLLELARRAIRKNR
jgi:hypothetical protein